MVKQATSDPTIKDHLQNQYISTDSEEEKKMPFHQEQGHPKKSLKTSKKAIENCFKSSKNDGNLRYTEDQTNQLFALYLATDSLSQCPHGKKSVNTSFSDNSSQNYPQGKNTVNYSFSDIFSRNLPEEDKFSQGQSTPNKSQKQDFETETMNAGLSYHQNETQNHLLDQRPQNAATQPPVLNKRSKPTPKDPKKLQEARDLKIIYNLIKFLMGQVKEEALIEEKYYELLSSACWAGLYISFNEFKAWLEGFKYGQVGDCMDVWSHKEFNFFLGKEYNHKVALRQITMEFLNKNKESKDIHFEKNCQYIHHYERFRRLILLAMESEHPESINFLRFFLQK